MRNTNKPGNHLVKRIIFDIIAVFGLFLLQCSLFQRLSIASISPNLLIVLTASVGFMRGSREGMAVGFFCGLLLDITSGSILGFYALIYLFVGFFNGFAQRAFYPDNIRLPMLSIILSDLLTNITVYICMFLLRGRLAFIYYFLHIMMPELVYTALVAIVLYLVILFIHQKIYKRGRIDLVRSK